MLRLDIFKAILGFAMLQFCGVAARPQPNIGMIQKRAPTAVLELRTNAARMAAGFPPLLPRQLYDATRVQARHDHDHAQPSGVPCSGHIKVVRASDGESIGWIKQSYVNNAGDSRFDTTKGLGNRLSVACPSPSSPERFNIAILDPVGSFPYLGFAGSNLGTFTSIKNDLTRTAATLPGNVAYPVGNGMAPGKPNSESSVWFFDSVTKQLTARWVNVSPPGYAPFPVDSFFWFVQGPAANAGLFLVGKTSGLGDGFEVKFYFE